MTFWRWLAVATALRLLLIGHGDLMKEEAYYWDYAQHPALSYFDHPPMIAWLVALTTAVGGSGVFWVRLPAVLLFTGACALIYATLERMGEPQVGARAVLLLNLLPIFTLYSLTISPDDPMLFFWALGIYAGWRVLQGSRHWWWVIGLACGLGMDSKYPALLVPLAVFLFCALRRRRDCLCWQMFGSAALAIVLFAPVLIWNVQTDFASFRFQGVERMGQASGVGERLGTWLIQLAIVGPLAFFPLWLTPRFAWLRRQDDRVLYLACTAMPFMAIVVYVSCRRLVQLNWPLPAYLGMVALLAWSCGEWSRSRRRFWWAGLAAYAALPWAIMVGSPSTLNRYDDLTHWSDMGARARQILASMPRPQQTFLFGHGYQAAAELAFSSALPQLTLSNNVIGERALAFDYWADPRQFRGWDALLVNYAQPTSSGQWRERVVLDVERLKSRFERVDPAEEQVLERGGKPLRLYRYYRCYGYRGPG